MLGNCFICHITSNAFRTTMVSRASQCCYHGIITSSNFRVIMFTCENLYSVFERWQKYADYIPLKIYWYYQWKYSNTFNVFLLLNGFWLLEGKKMLYPLPFSGWKRVNVRNKGKVFLMYFILGINNISTNSTLYL